MREISKEEQITNLEATIRNREAQLETCKLRESVTIQDYNTAVIHRALVEQSLKVYTDALAAVREGQ